MIIGRGRVFMKGSRRRFSREFKIEAVRQVLENERPVAQVGLRSVLDHHDSTTPQPSPLHNRIEARMTLHQIEEASHA